MRLDCSRWGPASSHRWRCCSERHGWTGDSQLQLEIGLLNLDAANFASNWLQILRDQMSYSGFITDIAPNPSGGKYLPMPELRCSDRLSNDRAGRALRHRRWTA